MKLDSGLTFRKVAEFIKNLFGAKRQNCRLCGICHNLCGLIKPKVRSGEE